MKGNTLRWFVGTVLVPFALALLTVFGVQVNDWLFHERAPALDAGDIRHLEHKITAIEAKIELLAVLYSQSDPQTAQAQPQEDLQTQPQEIPLAVKFQPLIHVSNDSRYLGRKLNVGQRTWEWTIYLSGTQEALDAVQRVIYRLHPTFLDPIHEIDKEDRGSNEKAFPFTATGWGTFNVGLTIMFDDGTVFDADHYLVFGTE